MAAKRLTISVSRLPDHAGKTTAPYYVARASIAGVAWYMGCRPTREEAVSYVLLQLENSMRNGTVARNGLPTVIFPQGYTGLILELPELKAN